MPKEIKQAIIIPLDLHMSPGKMAAQAAHAAVGAVQKVVTPQQQADLRAWYRNGMSKIVLQVATQSDLKALKKKVFAHRPLLPVYMVVDAGRTEVPPGSVTALAIGPGEIDSLIGSLPLFKGDTGKDT